MASEPTPPTYEENLTRLSQVVERLERGSLSLEESLQLFEQGMALSQLCDQQLTAVEERVKVLVAGAQLPEGSTRREIELEMITVEDNE